MDLSALIFVALAVAWAVYLVPKALRHHEEDAVSRSIEGFSDRLRVLARREPVSATEAELVTSESIRRSERVRAAEESAAEKSGAEEDLAGQARERRRRRRAAARQAAQRRRRVFSTLLLAVILIGALGVGGAIAVRWVAVPVVLVAGWLAACRLMVRAERARSAAPVRKRRRTLADQVMAEEDEQARRAQAAVEDGTVEPEADLTDTDSIPVVQAEIDPAAENPAAEAPERWAPVDVPLPTYVAKAPASRTVRTIDLDSTGVWSSGRNELDSQLAREADAQRGTTPSAPAEAAEERHRATGS